MHFYLRQNDCICAYTNDDMQIIIWQRNACDKLLHVHPCEQRGPYMSLYVQLFWFHVVSCCVEAVLGSPSSTQCSEWLHCFPCKEHYCPHSSVNWLITSLMRMERPVTMGHIVRWSSDFWTLNKKMLNLRKWSQSRRDSWTWSSKWKVDDSLMVWIDNQ